MLGRGRAVVVMTGLVGSLALAACGGSAKSKLASGTSASDSSTSAASSAPAESSTSPAASESSTTGLPNGPLDQCLTGSWKSTSIKASFPYGDVTVEVRGGADELFTVKADGTFTTDLSHVQPLTGRAGASTWEVRGTGRATGHLNTAGGRLSYNFDDPANALPTTITKDGTVLATVHARSVTESYKCEAGVKLTTTGEASTTDYVPAG